ncbi:MAG TPA: polymer-forming cytoskeletal protein [Candidatus Binatia bacterium]|jgi:cytoskeletal protein CcmA (bactofilin family)
MALFAKDDKVQRPDPARAPVSSQTWTAETPRTTESVQAHLGKGSRVEGKLTFEGSVEIDGCIDGEIGAQDAVIIGDSAVINAQIHAETIIIKGKVTGDLTARKRVELRAPGRLVGNITTPSLVIHEGVVFEGHCSMGGGSEVKADKSDRKVALFPKEERTPTSVRLQSEAVK